MEHVSRIESVEVSELMKRKCFGYRDLNRNKLRDNSLPYAAHAMIKIPNSFPCRIASSMHASCGESFGNLTEKFQQSNVALSSLLTRLFRVITPHAVTR